MWFSLNLLHKPCPGESKGNCLGKVIWETTFEKTGNFHSFSIIPLIIGKNLNCMNTRLSIA